VALSDAISDAAYGLSATGAVTLLSPREGTAGAAACGSARVAAPGVATAAAGGPAASFVVAAPAPGPAAFAMQPQASSSAQAAKRLVV
jgi:hypothetical protein